MSIRNFTSEELKSELERRETQPMPRPLEQMSFDKVIDRCKHAVEHLYHEGREATDVGRWVFEDAMEAVYGTDIWGWYNEQLG